MLTGIVVGVPMVWTKPIVNTVMLPAHAATTTTTSCDAIDPSLDLVMRYSAFGADGDELNVMTNFSGMANIVNCGTGCFEYQWSSGNADLDMGIIDLELADFDELFVTLTSQSACLEIRLFSNDLGGGELDGCKRFTISNGGSVIENPVACAF